MTTYHRNYLSPESQPWARDVEDRLLSIEQANALTAQETNNTLLQLNSSVQLLTTSSPRAVADTSSYAFSPPASQVLNIVWTAQTDPEIVIASPSSVLLVTIAANVTLDSSIDSRTAWLSFGVNGATPDGTLLNNDPGWPGYLAGGGASAQSGVLSHTRAVRVDPNVANTFNLRYGYTTNGPSANTPITFTERVISITPTLGT